MGMNMLEEISLAIRSAIPIAVSAPSSDEASTIELLYQAAKAAGFPLYVWTLDAGFRVAGINDDDELVLWAYNHDRLPSTHKLVAWDPPPGATFRDHSVGDAINYLVSGQRGLFAFVDIGEYLDQPVLRRLLKSVLPRLSSTAATNFAMVGQDIRLPDDLQGTIELIEIPLANEGQRLYEITALYPSFKKHNIPVPGVNDGVWPELLNAAATLSNRQIANATAKAVQQFGRLDLRAAAVYHEVKIGNLRRLGVEVSQPADTAIGGLRLMRDWIDRRAALFQSDGTYVPRPKGVVLVGHPGTGKSLAAKIIGEVLKVPVFKLEPDQLLGSLVGESEAKTKKVLQAISDAAPGVLWIDEIEKLFSGVGSGAGDSGVGDRVFGQVLQFLQDNKSRIFVVATANNISGLPPELTRKGRFDEIFFIDLPNCHDRKEVLSIHIRRWCAPDLVDAAEIDQMADVLATRTPGWAGAELAQLATEAAIYAVSDGRHGRIVVQDLIDALGLMKPLSETEAASFNLRRQLCSGFAPATQSESNGVSLRVRSFSGGPD